MRTIKIDDVCEIGKEIIDYVNKTDYEVVVVGYSDTIGELLTYLIKESDSILVNAEFSSPDIDGYEEAYYLIYDDEEIWVGKAQNDGSKKYILFDSEKTYVEEDFVDEYKKTNYLDDDVTVFKFDYEDEDDIPWASDDDEKPVSICMDDDECGFCFCIEDENNHTRFKYRGNKKLTPEKISEIINEYMF